jgi:hypothetical protein
MTTICKTAIRLSGLSLIAALMLTSHSATVEAKELCFEECTFEMIGSCWRWKKACLSLEVNDKGEAVASQSNSRSASRQNIPNHVDSLLLGGGLTTALGTGEDGRSFGNIRGADILH